MARSLLQEVSELLGLAPLKVQTLPNSKTDSPKDRDPDNKSGEDAPDPSSLPVSDSISAEEPTAAPLPPSGHEHDDESSTPAANAAKAVFDKGA